MLLDSESQGYNLLRIRGEQPAIILPIPSASLKLQRGQGVRGAGLVREGALLRKHLRSRAVVGSFGTSELGSFQLILDHVAETDVHIQAQDWKPAAG